MTEFLRFVVDTNVLVSRLLAPRSTAAQAVDLALARGSLLGSEDTLAELAGEAAAIISGDKDLLVLNPWHGIPILTPAAFIVR
ncbi:hypothetical protein [Thauera sp.]|jgi:predicted nucleic acid-binding protein|uniref:hypothetical protein n=1 Tax=Thauera sp. TaxID=1905334 RepID=UPI002A370B97|nr:hypothetical protein [Thauera sp.]MDX9886661.1 hypothetical protein [Thauera sp.]